MYSAAICKEELFLNRLIDDISTVTGKKPSTFVNQRLQNIDKCLSLEIVDGQLRIS